MSEPPAQSPATFSIEDLKAILTRPIAFHRLLAIASGSVAAGVFLSQLVYWSERTTDPDGWIYKTFDDWWDEAALSRFELETIRNALKKRQLLEEKRAGVPAKLFYRIHWKNLQAALPEALRTHREQLSKRPETRNRKPPTPATAIKSAEVPHSGVDQPQNAEVPQSGASANQNAEVPRSTLLRQRLHTESTTTTAHERAKEKARRNPEPASNVGVVFYGVKGETKAEELVTGTPPVEEAAKLAAQIGEEFGLSAEQIAVDAYGCINRHGLNHVQEQAELVRKYLQKHGGNAAKLMLSALRKAWKAPKTVPPPGKVKRPAPPAPEVTAEEFNKNRPRYEAQQRLWERASEKQRQEWLQDETLRRLAPKGEEPPRPVFLARLYSLTQS